MAELAVAFTVSGQRQSYLRRTLESWAGARGVQDVLLIFCCEGVPSFPAGEFDEFCARSFRKHTMLLHKRILGPVGNTKFAVEAAFASGAGFAVVAEEDVVVSSDILEYFHWAQRYQEDQQIAAVCAHVKHASAAAPSNAASRASWFSPLGWGTWEDRWASFLAPGWGGSPGAARDFAWDHDLRGKLLAARKQSLFPARSRTRHIGRTSTIVHPSLADHFFDVSVSDCYAADYGPQQWAEVPGDPEFELVV